MYKIKEVCHHTGLTEKTIRFYIEQKLITPKTEAGLHYKSYRFTDRDIQLLQDISALRSAEFTIAEIRQMLSDPSTIPALVAEKERSLSEKITALQSARESLSHLTISEQTDLSQLADAIAPRSPLRKETPDAGRNRIFWLLLYIGLFALLGFLITGGERPWLILYVLALLGGIEFPIMALGYFRYNRRHRRLPCRAEAVVVSVISDEGVGQSWEETSWDILLGILHFGFLHWSWIRPDHWVPLVQFEAEGTSITTAYRYGSLKTSWKSGQTIMVAWEPGKPHQLYPCRDAAIERKAWCYLLAGAAMALFFLTGFYVIL